jgi:carboxyl-terminal processing protease
MQNKKTSPIALSIQFAIILILGMYLGYRFKEEIRGFGLKSRLSNTEQIMRLIEKRYVDSVDLKQLEQENIEDLLSKLDPHSIYITPEEFAKTNEVLEGNFEGIGIEFYILNDTIFVVSAIPGGPSEMLGIRSGDKIIKIDDTLVAGKKISNADVGNYLRGEKGTKVKVSIKRNNKSALIDYVITRGTIPLNSVDVAYMASPEIGYIKVSSFGSTTYDEFFEALKNLKTNGLKSLILDLRGNSGGYLNTAIMIADELLEDKKLIVYTEGKSSPKKEEFATEAGNFEQGKLIVLIDEGSASASEIVAGAVQDWDRGIIVGRRSFGKGLVQEQATLADGSRLRLTIARYFTPTGRCIQKPYNKGIDDYMSDVRNRYVHGELSNADSILKTGEKAYKTPAGKIVYGGGGIYPDIFIPLDTSDYSFFYSRVVSEGILSEFVYSYTDRNKKEMERFKNLASFLKEFELNKSIINEFIRFAAKNDIIAQEYELKRSLESIKIQMKALIARQYFGNEGYYKVQQSLDRGLLKSIDLLKAN